MNTWSASVEKWGLGIHAISPAHPLSLGASLRAATAAAIATGTAWPAANRALFIPFRMPRPRTVFQIVLGFGNTITANVDTGIYDEWGNRLVSSGSTAIAAAASEQVFNVTDTVIPAGLHFMALALDSTDTVIAAVPTQVGLCKAIGMREMASAFALPATATYATVSSAYIPAMSIWFKAA